MADLRGKKQYRLVVQAQGYLINVYLFRPVLTERKSRGGVPIQEYIVLEISNWPRASQLFDLVLPELFSTRSSKRKKNQLLVVDALSGT